MRAALVSVTLLAAGLRFLEAARQYDRFLPQTEPEEGYYEMSEVIVSHRVFGAGIPNVEPQSWRGPLLPVLSALAQGPAPEPGRLRMAVAALSAASSALAFTLAATLASPLAAVAAGLAVALEPESVHGSLNIHVFYGCVLLALAAAAAWWAASPTRGRSLLMGLMIGASFLVRSAHYPLPVFLALMAPRRAGWLLLGVALALAPRPQADTRAGAVLLFGAALGGGVESMTVEAAVAEAEKLEPGFAARHPGASAHEGLLRLSRRLILGEPLRFARSVAARLVDLWRPLALPLALALLALARVRTRPMLAAVLTALSFSGYAVAGGVAEHRTAAWPLLLALSACALPGQAQPRFGRWLPAGGAALALLYAGFLYYLVAPRAADERRFAASTIRLAANFRDSSEGRRLAGESLARAAYRARGDCTLARELLKKALDWHPAAAHSAGGVLERCPDPQLERRAEAALTGVPKALALLNRGRRAEALAALRAERTPEARGVLAALEGRAESCLADLPLDRARLPRSYHDACVRRHPGSAPLWRWRGLRRLLDGDRQGAEADLRRAAGGDEQARDILEALAGRPAACLAELPLDRAKLPVSYFDGCIAKHPERASLWKDRGVARFLAGDRAGAREDLRRALALSPDDLETKLSLEAAR